VFFPFIIHHSDFIIAIMSRFLEALRSHRVLLMDGAMGTELQRAGLKDGECGEHWNLIHPDRVRTIHQSYKDAGARVFLTNSFQSNFASLRKHGLDNDLEKINQAAISLARAVCGDDGFVLGDIGPVIPTHHVFDEEELHTVGRVVRSLASADAILFETCSSHYESILAVLGGRLSGKEKKPILISFTFYRDSEKGMMTHQKIPPQLCAKWIHDAGFSGLGVNCGREIDTEDILEIIREYRQETDLPLFARPNAGTPTRVDDHWVYPRIPEQMAARLPELLEAGISMIGGCCGTRPEHIAAFRPIVEKWNAAK
jgi:5-methyltetrahydrofolate--homocysteine methyltransferase